jgi:hypothetical protein
MFDLAIQGSCKRAFGWRKMRPSANTATHDFWVHPNRSVWSIPKSTPVMSAIAAIHDFEIASGLRAVGAIGEDW